MMTFKKAKWVCIIAVFFGFAQALAAQQYFSIDAGVGGSNAFVSENGFSFGLFFEPKVALSPALMIGSKNAAHLSTVSIITLESQATVRWNFLKLGRPLNPVNLFVQGGIGFMGAFRKFDGGFDVHDSRSSLLADGTVGVTIPFGSSLWHIEPSIRGGYPFLYGAAVTVGRKIPFSFKRETQTRTEYIEVIRNIPTSEIIKRVLITQVEYVIFAPDIAAFNQGLDSNARALNELVLEQTARLLRENPDFHVRIEGHANPVTHAPTEAQELIALSEERANETARQLIARGANEEQIVVIAYGGARIVAGDHDHWNMNRRVELIVIQIDPD